MVAWIPYLAFALGWWLVDAGRLRFEIRRVQLVLELPLLLLLYAVMMALLRRSRWHDHEHEVPLIVVDAGRFVRVPLVHHFDLPALVLDHLTGGDYCRTKPCAFGRLEADPQQYVNEYRTVLGLGAR